MSSLRGIDPFNLLGPLGGSQSAQFQRLAKQVEDLNRHEKLLTGLGGNSVALAAFESSQNVASRYGVLGGIALQQFEEQEKFRKFLEGPTGSLAAQALKLTGQWDEQTAFERMQSAVLKYLPQRQGIAATVLAAAEVERALGIRSAIEKSITGTAQSLHLDSLLHGDRAASLVTALQEFSAQKSALDFMRESTRASDWLREHAGQSFVWDDEATNDEVEVAEAGALQGAPELVAVIFRWALEHKVTKKQLSILLLFICAWVLKPITDVYVQDYMGKPILEKIFGPPTVATPPIDVKRVLKEALSENRDLVADGAFRGLAVINKDSLTAHLNPRQKSPTVGTLTKGQAVKLLRENRDWFFVEYSTATGTEQGWVLRRYVLRVQRLAR